LTENKNRDNLPTDKLLPTISGQKKTKKCFIQEYSKNRPSSAKEIAKKTNTTPNYVYKVRSQARKPSKELRGRNGRIFAHGKVWYEWKVMPDTAVMLTAPILNKRTGMKQIGYKTINPCSCQIHPNGRIIIWPHSTGWKDWLLQEFIHFGWKENIARFVIESATLNLSTAEAGVKPLDNSFLPKELNIETEWGLVVVRDNTPEKGVLEFKLSIPDMKKYLSLPEINKRLQVLEQGSLSLNQSLRTLTALLISAERERHFEKNSENKIGKD
jgi:hypothetical protein